MNGTVNLCAVLAAGGGGQIPCRFFEGGEGGGVLGRTHIPIAEVQ